MMGLKGVVVVMVVVAVVASGGAAGFSCGDAVNALAPCASYLVGSGGADPSPQCCQSAQALNNMAPNADSRRALCECLKQTGPSLGVHPDRARHLPTSCKLKLTIPVSPNVDCSTV